MASKGSSRSSDRGCWRCSIMLLRAGRRPPPDTERSHKIAGSLWALIQGDLRILYFFDVGKVVICAAAFVKKSQKTPKDEIARAEAAASRYKNAKKAGRVEVEEESE